MSVDYDSVTFQDVYSRKLIGHLPPDGFVLDIGIGSGRDMRYFRDKGYSVMGVEPDPEWREQSPELNIVDDYLPNLTRIKSLGAAFNLIWISGTLHSLPTYKWVRCLRSCRHLLAPRGIIYIGVKGDFPPSVLKGWEAVLAEQTMDAMGRDITWTNLLLRYVGCDD